MMTSADTRFAAQPARTPRQSPLMRLLEGQIWLAALVWLGFTLFIGVIAVGIATWSSLDQSIWHQVSNQVPRFYVLFIGGYVGYQVLALHITHGLTRRQYHRLAIQFTLAFATAVALLLTIGFVLEAALYEVAGWERSLEHGRHLYDSPWELHLIFIELWLIIALWTAGGYLLGSAFYREEGIGALAIVVAIFIAGVTGIVWGNSWGPFGGVYEAVLSEPEVHAAIGIPLYLASIAVVFALAWQVVKDIAIKNKNA